MATRMKNLLNGVWRSSSLIVDAMVQLDWCAGEIMKALDEHGLADNTLVIFSSDNGPVYDDGYEDGTTVHTSSKEVDRGHDGSGPYRSVLPALLGKSEQGQAYMIEEARGLGLRRGPWKFIPGGKAKKGKMAGADELYNLDTDIGERENVAKDHPAVAREMAELLRKLKQADAGIRMAGD